jgi:transcriptional regulator with XRE-family HTH domain
MNNKLTKGRGRPSTKATGKAHPVDVHVGSRIRLRRTLLGMNQQKLGAGIGLTFQQVQKYENGANRVCASRLFELSQVLDVPVSFFFDGMDGQEAAPTPAPMPEAGEPDPMHKRETLELVRAYYRISDPLVRKRIFDLAKAVAAGGCDADA